MLQNEHEWADMNQFDVSFSGEVCNISCTFLCFWLIFHQSCCCDGHWRCRVAAQATQLQRCWCTPTNPTGRVKHSSICFHIPFYFHALFHCLSVNVRSMLSECLCLMEISFKKRSFFFFPSRHPSTHVTLSCTNMLAACKCLQMYIRKVNVFLTWQRIFFAQYCLFQIGSDMWTSNWLGLYPLNTDIPLTPHECENVSTYPKRSFAGKVSQSWRGYLMPLPPPSAAPQINFVSLWFWWPLRRPQLGTRIMPGEKAQG